MSGADTSIGALFVYPPWTCEHDNHDRTCPACWDNLVAVERQHGDCRQAVLDARKVILELVAEVSLFIVADQRDSDRIPDERQLRLRDDARALLDSWGTVPDA